MTMALCVQCGEPCPTYHRLIIGAGIQDFCDAECCRAYVAEHGIVACEVVDRISEFKPTGWSGSGHLHWKTEEDPEGDKGCPKCLPYLTPGACSLNCPVHLSLDERCPHEERAH